MILQKRTAYLMSMDPMKQDNSSYPKTTGSCYEGIAKKYADSQDTQPWNVHYERPGTLSLLPALDGLVVLDVGCGPGWYAEYLLKQEATVTAMDLNADFVALTKERVGDKAIVQQADLSEPLTFAENEAYDLIVAPLVLHYLKDWQPTLFEFCRVLKPNGKLVFSTHHPFMDFTLYEVDNYFGMQHIIDKWEVGTMRFYRRPLTKISEDLEATGFVIERLLEPMPTEAFRKVHPKGFERLSNNPWFLFVRARKGK